MQSGIGRTGPVFAIEHYGVEPDLMTTGKSIGGGLPLGGVTGRAEVMDAVHPGGLGGTFGGNPVSCAAAAAVLETVSSAEFRARSRSSARGSAGASTRSPGASTPSARYAASARCSLSSSSRTARRRPLRAPSPRQPSRQRASAASSLLACGLYSNVIRILVPIVIDDEDLAQGLDILEESLVSSAS